MSRKQRRAANRRSRAATAVPAHGPERDLTEAVGHHQAGRLASAERLYRKVLDQDPANADALHLWGVVCHQTGRDARAVELIGMALAANPDVALYHNNMGASLRALDKADEAIPHYRRAVELAPDYTEAHVNLGNALDATGTTEDATAAYRKALQIDPDHADAHTALGTVLSKVEDFTAAAVHFRRAVELEPDSALAHNNLGNILSHEKDTDGAIAEYRHAIALEPGYVEPHANLGTLLRDRNRASEAETELRQALALAPDRADLHDILGLALKDQDRLDEAMAEYHRAIAIDPNRAEALNNLGNALSGLGRREDAIAAFTTAIERQPDYEIAVPNRGLAYLSLGRFAEGWRDCQMRDSIRSVRDTLWREPVPETLAGKRVFVLCDQGLGDEIFFLRFVRRLKQRGAWIGYRSQHPIAAMVARLPFLDQVFDEHDGGSGPEDADLRLSAGDLPHLLGMAAVSDIPPSIELAVLADRSAALRARLAELGPPPYIGVTWRAGIQKRNSLSKIAPHEALAAVLAGTGGTVLALQRNPEPGEIERFAGSMGRELHDLTALNDDLEDMLAVMDLIDEYVCVSNTNTHLRAARGKPSRVLVPHPADYRWMDSGDESPWFPGTPTYRESPQAGWDAALERLAADLAAAVPPGSERPGR